MTKKKSRNRQYKVEILSPTYVSGIYRAKGTILKVSKGLYDRIKLEKVVQLRTFIK